MEEIESYKDVLKHVLKSIEENYTKTHNYKLEFDVSLFVRVPTKSATSSRSF